MLWWVAAVLLCFATGIVTLAAAGAEPPQRIQTFSHSSPAEQEYDHRVSWLLAVGLVSIAMAVLMGSICVLASLELVH